MATLKENYFYNLTNQILLIIIPFITTPYISRILMVDGIGIISFTQSIVSYFYLFANVSIGMYGLREIASHQKNDYENSKIFYELVIIKIITVTISLCVYFIVIQNSLKYYNYFLIFSIEIISCLFNVSWFFQGLENFKIIITKNIIIRIITMLLVFILIKTSDDLSKYILLIVINDLFTEISIIPFLLKKLIKVKLAELNFTKHIKLLFILFLPTIATQIYSVLDKSMIGLITRSAAENGYYEQAMKIIRLLLTIITSLSIVTIPRISYFHANQENNKISECLARSFSFLFLLSTPMFFGLFGIVDIFIPFFFGPGYEKTILLVKILSILFFSIGFNNVIGIQYLIPVKKENILTITLVVGAIVNFVLNIILIKIYQSTGAAISSVIAESLIAVLQFVYIKSMINVKKLVFLSWKYVLSSIVMFLILLFLKSSMEMNLINFVVVILSSCFIYCILLIILKDAVLYLMFNNIKRNILKHWVV
jgi:O-antigen/teichoic acid export membrane protein